MNSSPGITQSIINDSGALSAWDKVSAIVDFITEGNDTITFLRNNNGTNVPSGLEEESDMAYWILNNSFEGSCDQFTSLFAVMLRTADIPVRKVTGFSGGYWNGEAFEVYGKRFLFVGRGSLTNQPKSLEMQIWDGFHSRPVLQCHSSK